ncbi:hypothetical protein SeMB42_g03474 [Synchytrium endobioticum]|uniref:Uncharacterized protein n=1 Tax=Synchytrium endobioticum TaxID=286115 RepID=A0A507D6N9_9FUNG|nr:hypothetical protein SeMB42_g03474 [Synchytrium endobioticum]
MFLNFLISVLALIFAFSIMITALPVPQGPCFFNGITYPVCPVGGYPIGYGPEFAGGLYGGGAGGYYSEVGAGGFYGDTGGFYGGAGYGVPF